MLSATASIRRSHTEEPALAARSPHLRSAMSNGTKRLFGDGRSKGTRRYRDLLHNYAAEFEKPFDELEESVQQLVRRAAGISLELELLESDRASGKEISPLEYTTLCNAQRRILSDMKKSRQTGVLRHRWLARRRANCQTTGFAPL